MTALNKQALREAAEKALPAMNRLLMMPNDELFDEALLNVDGDVDAANAFNLLAGPETMLALLNELEAAEKRIAELEAREVTLRPVGVMSEGAFRRLENSESRFIALWPRPGIYLPRKRPDDGVIVYARTAAGIGVKGE
ncbi:ead/Ea22-like family protein [Citrobacter freundii]|uniref:ead/Ea22-like family protein n=1 Tax=Citrobacter freundii TaxID=546 RepID=UPI00237B8392|nr:ead/Ea22-like family protein [Citrobacter freundii]MDH0219041.1 ead/Ea22-like family protein [Citrobacter freundii]MDH0231358.1 ead/Ea22-like family protein [Citrobacter freundii]MDH0987079.1 ead/Ea22-like family protein [Citrobacter freundii]MDH1383543.1 ead/Ea22-like family protein [Citrobacter freundii]MDH1908908.1 ead/Ea22-like family protein [Citrobacter freundii]